MNVSMKHKIELFSLLLIAMLTASCSDDRGWIKTEEGYYFYGKITTESSVYTWSGKTKGKVIDGEGVLKVISDDGKYTDEAKIIPKYGILKDDDWKTTPVGKFVGIVEDSYPSGFGVLMTDSDIVCGEFDDGYVNDKEAFVFSHDGKLKYKGSMKEGLYHGEGELYNDGFILYKGEFKSGKYHGNGTLYSNGKIVKSKWSEGREDKSSIINQTARALNIITYNDEENDVAKDQVVDEQFYQDEETFMNSLSDEFSKMVSEQVKENVEDRFDLFDLPRILWQSIFSGDTYRKNAAEEALCEELSNKDLQDWINEKINTYNSVNGKSFNNVELSPIKEGEIFDEKTFAKIKDREALEWTDIILDIVITIIIIIVMIALAVATGGAVGCVIDIIIMIIVFVVVDIHMPEQEEQISNMVIDNYVEYFEDQHIEEQL